MAKLEPWAEKKGKSFVKYDSICDQVEKALVHDKQIVEQQDLIVDMKSLQQNLSFKKTDVRTAIEAIGKKFQLIWGLKDDFFEDWHSTLVRRFLNIMHIAHKDFAVCKQL